MNPPPIYHICIKFSIPTLKTFLIKKNYFENFIKKISKSLMIQVFIHINTYFTNTEHQTKTNHFVSIKLIIIQM